MTKAVKSGDVVLATQTGQPGQLRCTAVITDGEKRRPCVVVIQRSAHGDLVDGVVAHYQTCHPERKIR